MQKFLFDSEQGPFCTDGSPAGLYYHLASNSSAATKWVVWIEGGGFCESNQDCYGRSQDEQGSSNTWAPTKTGDQLVSANAFINPNFHGWNHVFVPYCSGDLWLGQQTNRSNPWAMLDAQGLEDDMRMFGGSLKTAHERKRLNDTDYKFYFSGHLILEAVLKMLQDRAPSEVLLTGCSAGGIGTFHHIDWLANALPDARVRGNPQAGWFGLPTSDYFHFNQHVPDPDPHHYGLATWVFNTQPYLSPAFHACMGVHQPDSNATVCLWIPNFYPFIATPLFVSENTVDSYQVFELGGCPQDNTPAVWAYGSYLHGLLAGSLSVNVLNNPQKTQDGLFSPACLAHCLQFSGSDAPMVQGVKHFEALANWYFGRPGPTKLLDNSTDHGDWLSCTDYQF